MSRNKRQRADGEEQQIWNEIFDPINTLRSNEIKSAEVVGKIFEKEKGLKADENAGISNQLIHSLLTTILIILLEPPIEAIDALGALYREGVKLAEDSKGQGILELISKVEILKGMVAHNEGKKAVAGRTSTSRDSQSAMDFDGPSDSPVPSPAENRLIRKMGAARPSSQPPREKDAPKEEKEERVKEASNTGRTKITFDLNAEVAFKPKIPNQTEEQDWIQGVVVKVIGEGKSRRYDVRDPYPDDPDKVVIYRSSASSMVPVPPEGTPLQDYEVGRKVLALYPHTSTFYRAEVKAMVDNGAKVQLLFEEESLEAVKEVARRFVLDHKG